MTDCGIWTIRDKEALTLSVVIVRCDMLDGKLPVAFIEVLNKGTGCKKNVIRNSKKLSKLNVLF